MTFKIAIVEDEKTISTLIEMELLDLGYEVLVFGNAEKYVHNDYDVVLLDLRFDGNKTALELIREVKKFNTMTQIIVMTGHGNKATVVELLRSSIADYIEKPFSIGLDLMPAIQRSLDKKNHIQSNIEKEKLVSKIKDLELKLEFSDLIRGFMHDVRNSLATAKMACEDLIEDGVEAKQLTIVLKSLNSIIQTANSITATNSKQFSYKDLDFIINEALFFNNSKIKDVNIIVNIANVFIYVNSQIISVFYNLISNAIDAMDKDYKEVKIFTIISDLGVEVCVQDNGSGIPEYIQKSLWVESLTTKANGSGFGSKTVYSIVNNHGFKISYETYQNVGTTFKVFIPKTLVKSIN